METKKDKVRREIHSRNTMNPRIIDPVDLKDEDKEFLIRLIKISKAGRRYDLASSIRILPVIRIGDAGEYISFRIIDGYAEDVGSD